MTKAEWGNKRTCPKCGTRFYDLGKDDPALCIDCGNEWVPEPILKTKQPVVREEAKPEETKDKAESESEESDDDLDIPAELDVDVEGDDDEEGDDVLVDISLDDEDADVNEIVEAAQVGDED